MIGNGTSAPTFVIGGTNGNVLTFNGTDWVSSAPATGGLGAAATKTANYTAVAGDVLACNTITTGAFSITLPASPVAGQKPIIIFDSGTTDVVNGFATNNLTVLRNGSTINTLADDVVFSTKGVSVIFEYIAGTWRMRIG
jgi:zona occludens toxin (predicted ATPase)